MKVWELKEGVEYKSLLNDVLKYRVDKTEFYISLHMKQMIGV